MAHFLEGINVVATTSSCSQVVLQNYPVLADQNDRLVIEINCWIAVAVLWLVCARGSSAIQRRVH